MKFVNLFELHKIPEWYHQYLEYKALSKIIKEHKTDIKNEKSSKLSGVFFLTEEKRVVPVPIFS